METKQRILDLIEKLESFELNNGEVFWCNFYSSVRDLRDFLKGKKSVAIKNNLVKINNFSKGIAMLTLMEDDNEKYELILNLINLLNNYFEGFKD